MQSVESLDRIVEGYLASVARACAGLPAGRVEELVADLREHIAVARGALPDETEADLRTILDRLGDPATIAAEAHRYEPGGPRLVRPRRDRMPAHWLRWLVPWLFGLVVFVVLVGYSLVVLVQPGDR